MHVPVDMIRTVQESITQPIRPQTHFYFKENSGTVSVKTLTETFLSV